MKNNHYITCPIDGVTSIQNTHGSLAQYMRRNHEVRGYVTQNDTPFYFHVADIIRCLIRDRNKTLQFLNTDRQMYGLNTTQFKGAMISSKRYYFAGDKEHNQSKSKQVKRLISHLWGGKGRAYTLSEARDIVGDSLWNEHKSHKGYVTLESKIFNDEPADTSEIQPPVEQSTESLAHVHEDGTFCLTVEQYEAAKQMDLLRFMEQSPKIVLQRAASR